MGEQASAKMLVYKNIMSLNSYMSYAVQMEDSAELQSSYLWDAK